MTTAILDTNVIVQYHIGSPRSASVRTLEAFYDGRFRIPYSLATMEECFEVLMLPAIRACHRLTDDEVLDFLASLFIAEDQYPGTVPVSVRTTRDVTDTKFLSVAVESRADYLVTNDRRHLLPIKRYRETKIVTPARFLRALC